MTKRHKAMVQALALHRASKELEKLIKTEWGMQLMTFWFYNRSQEFRNPKDMRKLANKIAREAMKQ